MSPERLSGEFEPTDAYKERVRSLVHAILEDTELDNSGTLLGSKRRDWHHDGVNYAVHQPHFYIEGIEGSLGIPQIVIARAGPTDEADIYGVRIYWYDLDTAQLHVLDEFLDPEEVVAIAEKKEGAQSRFRGSLEEGMDFGLAVPSQLEYAELIADLESFEKSILG